MTQAHRKVLGIGLLSMATLAVATMRSWALTSQRLSRWISPDFFAGYFAAKALYAGANPYAYANIATQAWLADGPVFHGNIPGSTPALLWAFQLFHSLGIGPQTAATLWFVVSLAASLAGIELCRRIHTSFDRHNPSALPLIAALFAPFYGTLLIGQTTALALGLVSLSAYLLLHKKPVAAASLVGAAGAVKVYPLALLAFFALGGQWTALACGVVTVVALQLPALATRPTLLLEFADAASHFIERKPGKPEMLANQSFWGLASRLTTPNRWCHNLTTGHTLWFYLLPVAAIWTITVRAVSGSKASNRASLCGLFAVLCAAAVSTPFFWHHAYLLLLPAIGPSLAHSKKITLTCLVLITAQPFLDIVPLHGTPLYYLFPLENPALLAGTVLWAQMAWLATPRRHPPLTSPPDRLERHPSPKPPDRQSRQGQAEGEEDAAAALDPPFSFDQK